MIPRFKPALGAREILAALRGSDNLDVARFETSFAKEVGQLHAVAFPYGRTGLLMLLKALGLQSAEIICPAYTCVVVPHAIVLSGNIPVFVDSGTDANMDLDAAEALIGPQTRALIATSIFGHSVDLEKLANIQQRHPDLIIIQDCAHSFLSEWQGEPVHRAGRAAVFGMNASKMMMSVFGGMITTDDATLARRLREIRDHNVLAPPTGKTIARFLYLLALYPAFWQPFYGVTETLRQSGLLDRFTRYYDESVIDMPRDYLIGMSQLEARVGQVQTMQLRQFIEAHRAYAEFFRNSLANLPTLSWVDAPHGSSFSHIAARVGNKRDVMDKAHAAGVQLGEVIEYSIPEMAAYRSLGGDLRAFSMSAAFSRQTINLPVSGRFNLKNAERIAKVLRQILEQQPPVAALPN